MVRGQILRNFLIRLRLFIVTVVMTTENLTMQTMRKATGQRNEAGPSLSYRTRYLLAKELIRVPLLTEYMFVQ